MRRREILFCLISVLAFLPACQFFENADFANLPLGSPDEGTVGRVTPELGALDVASGCVRVLLVNGSGEDVDVRVTMRVAGERVHFSSRRMPADSEDIVVGPDRADSILVEATLLTSPPLSLPMQSFILGEHFHSGDMLRVEILAPAPPVLPPTPPQVTPPTIAITGLDSDVVVNPNETVAFDVVVADVSAAALVRVFADTDQDPDSGNEINIRENEPAADTIPVSWTVPAQPGWYLVYAEVQDGTESARYGPATGRVQVRDNLPPTLVFDSPRDGQAVTLGHIFIIGWAGQDDDDDASITIFLDTNQSYDQDGSEQILRDGISEDDVNDRQHAVDTSNLNLGIYYVGGVITDGFNTVVVYGPQVLITSRLVGRFTPDKLLLGEITTITGGADNTLFGTDIDISRSLNPFTDVPPLLADELAEVLISDPIGRYEVVTGDFQERGIAYLYWSNGVWPRDLLVDDPNMWWARMIGEQQGSNTGMRVALAGNHGYDAGDVERDVVIGAPQYFQQFGEGAAYHLATAPRPGETEFLGGGRQDNRLTGAWADQAGLDVAALGDLNGDSAPDFAVGATQADGAGSGRVFVIPGKTNLSDANLESAAGITLLGRNSGDLTGYAICGVPNVHTDPNWPQDEIAIGAPTASSDPNYVDPNDLTNRPGVVYVVFGEMWMLSSWESYWLGGLGGVEDLQGLIFVGENAGDLAGWSVATGDFDGDGRPDLLIGAPGYDYFRGRVFLIYDLGGIVTTAPATIDLGLVGTTYAGAVFDGLAVSDWFGHSLTAADFDADGNDDPVMSAPASETERGAAYLVYGVAGAQRLAGAVDLTQIGLIDLLGWELVGNEGQISRLGESLSGGGDLDGDLIEDVGVGAPGDAFTPGEAHLLFGR